MEHSVCFIGHRNTPDTPELRERLREIIVAQIQNGTVNFLFGDRSAFNHLCYETVTALKEKYPAIRRIRFRRDYEVADDYTMPYLLVGYEESICPKGVGNAGRASYVERNQAMIRESDFCIFYYDEDYAPPKRKTEKRDTVDDRPRSGTALAYAYAVQKRKTIINLFPAEKAASANVK